MSEVRGKVMIRSGSGLQSPSPNGLAFTATRSDSHGSQSMTLDEFTKVAGAIAQVAIPVEWMPGWPRCIASMCVMTKHL